MRAFILGSVIACGMSACGNAEFDSERLKDKDRELERNALECRKSEYTGCIQGQIAAAPEIYVAGEKFFDANDLALRINEILKVEDVKGTELMKDQYELVWVDKMNNEDFARDFQVYLKGDTAKNETVLRNGNFTLNYLHEGLYDVRVQKTFELTIAPAAADSTPSQETTETPSTEATNNEKTPATPAEPAKNLCLTLYSIEGVEVREGYRSTGLVVDRFEMDLKICGEEKNPTTTVVL